MSSLFERLSTLKRIQHQVEEKWQAPARGELPPGQEVVTSFGRCYRMERYFSDPMKLGTASFPCLDRRLELLKGVGPVTSSRLREEGFFSILDLVQHPRWGAEAREVLALIGCLDFAALRARGARDQDWLGYYGPSDIVFLDIETTGLWPSQPLFLIGLLRQGDIPGHLIPQTYLRFTRSQQPELINAILEHNALDLVSLARLMPTLLEG